MRGMSWLTKMGIVAVCWALSGCSPAALPSTPILPTPTPPPAATVIPAAVQAPNDVQEKLSSRLQILQKHPSLLTGSAEDLGKALSLPPNSLSVDDKGRILVTIRVKDTSDATVQALKGAGAEVVHVSAQYGVVTANVSAVDLTAITGLSTVLSVQEEMAPQTQGAGG